MESHSIFIMKLNVAVRWLGGHTFKRSVTKLLLNVNDIAPWANMSDLMETFFATLENWFCRLELKTNSKKTK